jgi:hypothetical protein
MIHLPTPGLRSRRSTMGLLRRLPAAALTATLFCGAALAKPVEVPFDFSRGAIGLDVTVKGVPLFVILDTGVDPSVIDINRAEALALNVDRAAGGEAVGLWRREISARVPGNNRGAGHRRAFVRPGERIGGGYQRDVGGLRP